MKLEDLQKLSIGDKKKVSYTNDYYPGWGIYSKFVAFSSIAALLTKWAMYGLYYLYSESSV